MRITITYEPSEARGLREEAVESFLDNKLPRTNSAKTQIEIAVREMLGELARFTKKGTVEREVRGIETEDPYVQKFQKIGAPR